MKVLTLDYKLFRNSCFRLARKIMKNGYEPDLVVGIRTGGEYVALEMLKGFSNMPKIAFVDLQRPSTPSKAKMKKVLRALPESICNFLRKTEAKFLSFKKTKERELPVLPNNLKELGKYKILVCDDAIDSGATMLAVVKALKKENPESKIKTAVLTVTTKKPLITPDYSLFSNLLRFPWSMDMKNNSN